MDLSASIHELVAATLVELGIPAPSTIIQTMLMHDGYYVGHKFRYDGGHAVLQAGGDTLELYDQRGNLLKAITLEAGKGAAA